MYFIEWLIVLILSLKEFNCDSRVDFPTMLCHVGLKAFKRHYRVVMDMTLNTDPAVTWCPNARCGRVICVATTLKSPNYLHCDCGYNFCLACSKAAHWPATCAQNTDYLQSYTGWKSLVGAPVLLCKLNIHKGYNVAPWNKVIPVSGSYQGAGRIISFPILVIIINIVICNSCNKILQIVQYNLHNYDIL